MLSTISIAINSKSNESISCSTTNNNHSSINYQFILILIFKQYYYQSYFITIIDKKHNFKKLNSN